MFSPRKAGEDTHVWQDDGESLNFLFYAKRKVNFYVQFED
jgi:hypothetical protein